MYLSPWLYQLRRQRPLHRLVQHQKTDVVIIGGGIAGAVTAYHILRDTTERVVLLEAHRVGHGASGHNAGMMVAKIERPTRDLVQEFGEEVVKKGLRALDRSWDILETLRRDLELQTPIYPCPEQVGFTQPEPFLTELDNVLWRARLGLPYEPMKISRTSAWIKHIPKEYASVWEVAEPDLIRELLEHDAPTYQAVLHRRMACGNSALLSEEIIRCLLERYRSRVSIFEETHVTEVICDHAFATVRAGMISIKAKSVVLCTNGFEQFHIKDAQGISLDPKFHTLVKGEVAYMEGFLLDRPAPIAGFEFIDTSKPSEDPYIYISRRPFEYETKPQMLISVGGPEYILPDGKDYDPHHAFPLWAHQDVDRFLKSGQKILPLDTQRVFQWHGLMGYTPNRVRCVGFEPCRKSLLYNLGCNGIGLMPSMYGGWKIAQLLRGTDDDVRLFDPQDRRCRIR